MVGSILIKSKPTLNFTIKVMCKKHWRQIFNSRIIIHILVSSPLLFSSISLQYLHNVSYVMQTCFLRLVFIAGSSLRWYKSSMFPNIWPWTYVLYHIIFSLVVCPLKCSKTVAFKARSQTLNEFIKSSFDISLFYLLDLRTNSFCKVNIRHSDELWLFIEILNSRWNSNRKNS